MTSRRDFLAAIPALALSPLAIGAPGNESDRTVPRSVCEADIDRCWPIIYLDISLDGVKRLDLLAYSIDGGWVRALRHDGTSETLRGRVAVRWQTDATAQQARAEYEAGLWPTCADLLSGREL